MEKQTTSGFCEEAQEQTQRTDLQEDARNDKRQNSENQSSHKRMDKLLCPWFHENSDEKHRRTSENKITGYHLETVESAKEKAMGFAKAWDWKRSC